MSITKINAPEPFLQEDIERLEKATILGQTVTKICEINHMGIKPDEKSEKIKVLFSENLPKLASNPNDRESYRAGILAEVCVRLALQAKGIQIHEVNPDEDADEFVDLIFGPKDGVYYATQVKLANIPMPEVIDLGVPYLQDTLPETLNADQRFKIIKTAHGINQYLTTKWFGLAHPDMQDKTAPLAIVVPGRSADQTATFTSTGEPLPAFTEQLYSILKEKLNW